MHVDELVGPKDQSPLLKGSDIAESGKEFVTGVILNARSTPRGFGSALIIDFDNDVLPGIASWGLNVTQIRALSAAISPVTENWRGWGIMLTSATVDEKGERIMNPNTQRPATGIKILGVRSPNDVKKSRKTKPKYTLPAPSTASKSQDMGPALNWDNVPF